jgi:hypothetical protein
MFFVLPCIDQFTKVDIRTVSYDVPPQEVGNILILVYVVLKMFNAT